MRILSKKVIISVLTVSIIGMAIYALPMVAVKPIITQIIRENGFPDAQVSSVSVMTTGMLIDHISLDGDDFSMIDGINIECNWWDLISAQKLKAISVKNITIAADLDENGNYKISGWDTKLPKSSGAAKLLPIDDVVLQGVVVDVTTPKGDIRVEGKFALNTAPNNKQNISYSIWAQQKQLSFDLSGSANIDANGGWSNETTINDGRIDFAPYEVNRLSGYIKSIHDKTTIHTGHIVAGRVNVHDTLWQNLDFTWDSGKNQAMTFSLNPSGNADININGAWNTIPQDNVGFTISAPNVNAIANLVSLNDQIKSWGKNISPIKINFTAPFDNLLAQQKSIDLLAQLGDGDNTVNINGTIKTDNNFNDVTVDIAQNDINVKTIGKLLPLKEKFKLSPNAGNAQLSVQIIIPIKNNDNKLTIKSSGELKIKNTDVVFNGLNLHNINSNIAFKNDGKDELLINSFSANLAGGNMTLTPFILQDKGSKTTLALQGVNIEEFIPLFNINGLKGSGVINGKIPMQIGFSGVKFNDASIVSDGGGMFSFAPDVYPNALQGDDVRMKTVREALKDFHFSQLSISTSGAIDGKMNTVFKTEGTNPNFGARPIHINLNLDGNLSGAIKSLTGN